MLSKSDMRIEHRDLSIHSTNPFVEHNSSPRSSMYASHINQAVVLEETDVPYILTGGEKRVGELTKDIVIPEDAIVEACIYRYNGVGTPASKRVETLILYYGLESTTLDYIVIPTFDKNHQYFGYYLQQTDIFTPGMKLYKGQVLASTPSKTNKEGWYGFGRNLNTAFMDMPGVAEDGFIVCEDVLEKLAFHVFERRTLALNIKGDDLEGIPSINIPLNLYGDSEKYKVFPDIGEPVRPDGVLMSTRRIRFSRLAAEASRERLMVSEAKTDYEIFTRNNNGVVVDVEVLRQPYLNNSSLLPYVQLDHYANLFKSFYKKILDAETLVRQKYYKSKGELRLSNKCISLFEKARLYAGSLYNSSSRGIKERAIRFVERKDYSGDYRLSLTVNHRLIPGIGSKLSDRAGGKGVIVEIRKPEQMPVDQYGVRADIIVDKNSIISRMNPGRYYEQTYNYTAIHTTKKVREILNLGQTENKEDAREKLRQVDDAKKKEAIQYLKGLYKIVSPKQYRKLQDSRKSIKDEVLATIVDNGVFIWKDISDPREPLDIVRKLIESDYYPKPTTVSWMGFDGNIKESRKPILIAPTYIMLLEKIGDSGMASASPLINHVGVFTKAPKQFKHRYPIRLNPVRIIGESETRVITSYTGPLGILELLDQGSSLQTHREIYKVFLNHDNPTNIDRILDRDKFIYGRSTPIQIVEHVYFCQGIHDFFVKCEE